MTLPGQLVAPRRSRLRVGLGAAVVLLLIGLAIAVLVSALGSHGTTTAIDGAGLPGATPTASAGPGTARSTSGQPTVFVHVVGAVAHPGLFPLRDGDRVVDAIAAAGGFTDTADQAQVNLARFITDGEQLVVPVLGAQNAASQGAGQVGPAGGAGAAGGKVNLNTADLTTLETLPRVGPAMAQRIIDWRTTNGRFTAVEDLMSVSGIGDKTFEQLKELVVV